ncbi:lysophospholipid acyltransferase family protein [Paenibacillus psychroresistens]|uniref:lysophospholipid acyltransferase family protein n=1 Tax=Paenibacillus psychroresistens TaxID=1778678 RepID=UPI00139193C1|nr:lysophospholipid acyltransferase family protein [Paenibacillus psychroresistens]
MYEWIGKLTRQTKRFRQLANLLHLLPDWLLYAIFYALGNLIYLISGTELRNRIRINMDDLLVRLTRRQIRRLLRAYYRNLAVTLFEVIFGFWRLPRGQAGKLHTAGEHFLQEALSQGKGAIIYAPHVGNFFYYYWYLSNHYNCLTVGTSGSPELKPIYSQYEQMGCLGLDYDETSPLQMIRTLRNHLEQNGVIFILGDFWRRQFPLTELFGKRTRGPQGAAALALDQMTPVIPFSGFRTKGFSHHLVFEEPIYLHELFSRSQRSEAALLLNHSMEQTILSHPEQWFYWFNLHDRWEQD